MMPDNEFPLFVESHNLMENHVYIFRENGRQIAFDLSRIGLTPRWDALTLEEKRYLKVNYK